MKFVILWVAVVALFFWGAFELSWAVAEKEAAIWNRCNPNTPITAEDAWWTRLRITIDCEGE